MTDSNVLSRRSLLGGLAATSTVVVAGCGDTPAAAGPNPDIPKLNALITAEYVAIKAYQAGLSVLAMPPPADPFATQATILAAIAMNWQTQHRAHAAELDRVIRSIGGVPVAESSVMFAPPTGFTGTVANVLKLACNLERQAAVAYNSAVKDLSSTTTRFLAGTIEGDETQHFIVLYTLLKGVVMANGVALISNINEVVPQPFVAQVGTAMNSLQSVPDYTYM